MREENRPPLARHLVDILYRKMVGILIVVTIVFVAVRIFEPQIRAAEIIAQEGAIRDAILQIHRAQTAEFVEGAQRCASLFELHDRATKSDPKLSAVARLETVEHRGVELLRGFGYYLAMYRDAPLSDDEQTWKSEPPTANVGTRAYGLFAWPIRYSPETQWAYFVDQRGKLLGTWNFDGRFSGLDDPFPPPEHPLAAYMQDARDGEGSDWYLFRARIDEIPIDLLPADADASDRQE